MPELLRSKNYVARRARRLHKYTTQSMLGRSTIRPLTPSEKRSRVIESFEEFCCRQFERLDYRLSDEGEEANQGYPLKRHEAPTGYYRHGMRLKCPPLTTHEYEYRR
jgi:hypothetical protein